MKTRGQRLYEHHHPPRIRVVRVEYRHFPDKGDVFEIPNPAEPTPWMFLTEACRQGWEKTAHGHWLFTEERKKERNEDQDE